MKEKYVKSSPFFFSIIIRSMIIIASLLFLLAIFIKAPLGRAADPAVTPNPLKSAWFLLWIQEIVSWSKLMIYIPLMLAAAMLLLPHLSSRKMSYRALWFPPELKYTSFLIILVCAAIIILTIIPYYYRGENWLLLF